MCKICGTEWVEPEDMYPNGPCSTICPDCDAYVSPCCGAKEIQDDCGEGCEICDYCGTEKCSECGAHTHCGGCV